MGIEDAKPQRAEDYPAEQALLCERTLITLLRGCGPWKRGMYLAGGLVPRYLPRDPEAEEEHAGTQDIDLVLDLDELADTDAYRSLERNLKQLGFARSANPQGQARHFSWVREVTPGQRVVVDFLCKAPGAPSGRAVPVEKRLSALQIPGAHLVVEDHLEIQVQADLLEERGAATETIRVANLTPFLILRPWPTMTGWSGRTPTTSSGASSRPPEVLEPPGESSRADVPTTRTRSSSVGRSRSSLRGSLPLPISRASARMAP